MTMFYNGGADTDLISSQSTLSTSYTSALTTYLQTSAADYIGYLAYTTNNVDLDTALAIVDAVAAGQFTLSDLFSAAQTKTLVGDVDSYEAGIANPEPKLTVNGVTIDLTAILSNPDVAYWVTTTKKDTIYHLREFYTSADAPAGYTEGWSVVDVNVAPEAVSFTEAANEWNIKPGAPTGDAAVFEIDLLQGVTMDADGDPISVVAGSVTVGGILVGNDTDLYTVDGNTLKINTNSEYFNLLFAGQTTDLTVTYQITDNINPAVNSGGTVTVTGTADQFTMTGTVEGLTTTFPASFDGSFNVLIPTSSLVAGADAYSDFSGSTKVTAIGDLGGYSEFVMVTVEGSTALKLGGEGTTPYASTNGNNDGSSSVSDTEYGTFSSGDATVLVAYDSQTSNTYTQGVVTTTHQHVGVDAMTSITVELSNITYWA